MDPEARVVVTARDKTGAAFASADRNLRQLQRSISGVRQIAGALGVVFSARAFIGWIGGAVRAAEATGEHAETVKATKDAMLAMKAASDALALSIADKLTPAMQGLTAVFIGWNRLISRADPFPFEAAINATTNELRAMEAQLAASQGMPREWRDNFSREIDAVRAKLAELRLAQEQALGVGTGGLIPPTNQLQEIDVAAIKAKRMELMRSMPKFDPNAPSEEQLRAAQRLTEQMKTDVEKQVEAWNEAEALFRRGLITPETLNRFRDSLLEPIEVTAERMKEAVGEMTEEATAFAATMGEAFRDSFADWIVGADRSFKDLLKRMAADIVTSGIFDAFATMFSGGTSGVAKFFGSFFGGGRAEGGPIQQGKWYIAGENGPEPIWGGGSGAFAMGYPGGSFVFNTNIDARGADPSLIQRLPAILDAHRQQTKAEIRDLMRRNRF